MVRITILLLLSLLADTASATTFAKCKFDSDKLSFAGTEQEQARCLLRNVRILGKVDSHPANLPIHLSSLVGKPTGIARERLRKYAASLGLSEDDIGGSLAEELSRANNNDRNAPLARYFVIHDTSTPLLRKLPFPADIDTSAFVNDLDRWRNKSNAPAHIFLNRKGEIYVGHKFSVPWRATRLESKKVGVRTKGLFLHIENIQPRAPHPSQADGNAPDPGLSAVQYERLALLYLAASFRAGRGLVPAFHAAIDEGISGGHDDPQNFDLSTFDTAIGTILAKVKS